MIEGLIALQLYPSQLKVGSAGHTTGRITPIGYSDQHWTSDQTGWDLGDRVEYDGRRVRVLEMGLLAWGRIRWRSVDLEGNRDQQGDHDHGGDRDKASVGYASRSATRKATAIE